MSATSPAPFKPRLVAFVCNWCTYAGADLAGTSRKEYDPAVRIIRVPCSGRIDPMLALRAFARGADGVIVSGCHPGDCHYTSGNLIARRRFQVFRHLMDALGLEPGRLKFTWISAAEGALWAKTVTEMADTLRRLGPFLRFAELEAADGRLPPPARYLAGPPAAAPGLAGDPARAERERAIRERAAALLSSGEVDLVIGYERGRLGAGRPAFVTAAEDTARLVFGPDSPQGLAGYLTRPESRAARRVAAFLRPCDARAAVVQQREKQLDPERVLLIGVRCPGVAGDSGELAARCRLCPDRNQAAAAAEMIGPEVPAAPAAADAELDALTALAPDERWAFWAGEFARCTRCHACRQACPVCACDRCLTEKNRPDWVPASPHGLGGWLWNVLRGYHLAGRCVACGQCARVCPEGIRTDLLHRYLARQIRRDFGYDPAAGADEPILLACHAGSDPEGFLGGA